MKRSFALLALSLVLFSGCGGPGADTPTLYIYNWTYYTPDDVLKEFENRYHVRIVYDQYASNEEMYAKLKAGGSGYDLCMPSGDFVSIMIREGMVEKLDRGRIPNFANIDSTVLDRIKFDPGVQYCVPYMMASSGITVNKAKVPNFERSWTIFGRSDLKGRMTMLDDMREVFGAALKTLGYSVNSTDPKQLEEAKRLILKWKPNLVKFDAESFGKGFAAGEFWAVHGYAENVSVELDDAMRPHAEFFIPKEGGPMYVDAWCILKGAKNQDLAYKFLNFIHEPQIMARIADYLNLPTINVPARAVRQKKPSYEITDLGNSEIKEDLGDKIELYNKLWQEIQVGS